jgi:hypothetical protein
MTDSESKFRTYLKKAFKDAYIKKMPDKKQTGLSTGLGLPDYLVINKGDTFWVEVKLAKDKKYTLHTFNLNLISESQWIEFRIMHNAGAKIYLAIYLNTELYIVPFDKLLFSKFISGDISIHKDILTKWRIKWYPE